MPRASTAAIRSETGRPSPSHTRTTEPTVCCSHSSFTTIEPSSRSPMSPATTGSRATRARAFASSTARASEVMSAEPSSRTWTAVGAEADSVAPGTGRTLSASPVTTRSARVRSRASAALAAGTVIAEPATEPASATVTSTGAATEAVRRSREVDAGEGGDAAVDAAHGAKPYGVGGTRGRGGGAGGSHAFDRSVSTPRDHDHQSPSGM
ncbi:hypothetical protein [Streptomyces gelaticus]|uniref:hypothetical protein n=1 Tax=Streptomyces gelaticus TaxID=285446 RepID=UPI001671CAEE|nr:hypothetical protein [Streptomyces gelaticus]